MISLQPPSNLELELRDGAVDVKDDVWIWIKEDTGLWKGPMEDWPKHKGIIEKYLTHRTVCVQAGGGAGMYPRLLGRLFSRVYTFEPDAENFFCLVNNACERNIFKINGALGANPGLCRFRTRSKNNRGTHKVSDSEGERIIPMFTIDQLDLPECDLIWLDVEGGENEALKGARNTIKRCQPLIMAESGHKLDEIIEKIGYEKIDHSVADSVFAPKNKYSDK